MNSDKIIFIVGPTAVGKSDVAFYLAQDIGGEIVSCDSMQIYKEIVIASNKPSQDEMKGVPHHLIDVVSVEEEFDVARYNEMAQAVIGDILNRGLVPIVTGGSGMYMQILLDGIFRSGERNEVLRKDLKEQARQYGNQFLYDKLKTEDPAAAAKIHPNDLRRVIRALEICINEKARISDLQREREGLWGRYDIKCFALDRERQELYARINRRVEKMIEEGLVEEIRGLSNAKWSLTAKKIIGVEEMRGFLSGEYDLNRAKELMQINTRHLAKRQMTWFRKEKRLQWITVTEGGSPKAIAGEIKEYL